jgi:hypothetical protein
MKLKISGFLLIAFSCVALNVHAQPKLSIDLNKTGVTVSPTQNGIFFEDINHAADGGLYAELIRNRSFEDAITPDYRNVVTQGSSLITASIDTTNRLNAPLTKAIKLIEKVIKE